ncbi:MAG: sortase [Anaerolineae bacterium]|nr:sortase [Anaerolineae bacterium]
MNRRRLSTYQSRGSSGSCLTQIILLGIIIGMGFLLFDRWRTPSAAPQTVPTQVQPVTIEPTVISEPASSAPTATPIQEARVLIPTAGVNALVVNVYLDSESWDVSQLGGNAGHLQGTAWFDTPGNIALAGHAEMADGSAGIFARIEQLRLGDPIILTLGDRQQRYSVTDVRRTAPDDLTPLYPTTSDQVTLITCDGYNFLQNAYQERIVVVAERMT